MDTNKKGKSFTIVSNKEKKTSPFELTWQPQKKNV